MKSTGEVMGIDNNFDIAFLKSQTAAGINLPKSGTVFLSVKDKDKDELIDIAIKLVKLGFILIGTNGTCNFLIKKDVKITKINKNSEGSPHVVDLIESNEISLVINTTEGKKSTGDSYIMRRKTLLTNTPYYTTNKGAKAAVNSIEASKKSDLGVASLQSIQKRLTL